MGGFVPKHPSSVIAPRNTKVANFCMVRPQVLQAGVCKFLHGSAFGEFMQRYSQFCRDLDSDSLTY